MNSFFIAHATRQTLAAHGAADTLGSIFQCADSPLEVETVHEELLATALQVTTLGGANFAPSWHPDGKRLIFASNIHDPKGRNFDLYLINVDGTGLEQVTFNGTFDGFPMFSPDGTRLVFASNRDAKSEGETNVFVADWRDR